MATLLSVDDIDFAAYMRDTDCKAKIRAASEFSEDLIAELQPTTNASRAPGMFSSRLGCRLGFRPGELTIWAGYNGHRKSTFSGQVAAELCKQGQRVLLASFEMLPRQTLARMARQVLATPEPSRAAVEQFGRWSDGRLWIFDHLGRVNPRHMLAVCRYFAEECKGQHVFVDSLMMVCASEESLDEQKQFMTDLVRLAQETELHVHLVAHCRKPTSGDESKPPSKYDIRGTAAISDQAHNVVTIWFDRARAAALERDPSDSEALAKPSALVTVEKQRNGSYEGRLRYWQDETSLRFIDDRTTRAERWSLDSVCT
ncbi:MAG: AAA family ATPase [Paucibacter sp.]|nr:AAA family ATPase [Roseateles sp.]